MYPNEIARRTLANNVIQKNLVEENDVIRINYTTRVLNGEKEWLLNKNLSPTLTTRSSDEIATTVRIKNATEKGYLEAEAGDGIDISSRMPYHRGTVQKQKAQTLNTMGGRM